MWYQYQIINRLSKDIKAESFEQFDHPDIAKEAAKLSMKILSLNEKIYSINIIPTKENFESRLKNLVIKFDVREANSLVVKIAEYTHCGGMLNNAEKHLLDTIEAKIIGYNNFYYENSYR